MHFIHSIRNSHPCSSALLGVYALFLLFGILLSGNPARAAGMLKIGLLQEPETLNIWRASDAWSQKVLSEIYQPLYVRDPDTLRFVPWLAAQEPVFDPQTVSYDVKLRAAKWSDGTDLTSEDVAFTGRFIKEFKIPRHLSKWEFIKKIETPDKHTLRFYLRTPKAIFLTRTLTTPIVQKKEWARVAQRARKTENPLATLLNHKVDKPVGSGPFILKEWRAGEFLYLEKNDLFFGTGQVVNGRVLGPYISGITFKTYKTSDAAISALKMGGIDMFWWGIQPGYFKELQQYPDIHVFNNEQSALYYMGFNVRKPPFNDVNLRRAVAALIDRDLVISRILQGYGIKMYSIVPPGDSFWYCPDVPRYCKDCTREQRIVKAYEILSRAGYTWEVPPVDKEGKIVNAEGIRLPDGKPMGKFTILTPTADYDPHRAMCGIIIQEWLRLIGIPVHSRPMAFGSLIRHVKMQHDFDVFILGYGRLSLDPDYLRSFFISGNDKPGGLNMSGYSNPVFDKIADKSESAMHRQYRRKLIWEMQKMIIGDVPYIPLYNPKLLEAVRKEKFSGWVQMLGGIGNIWSFCQLKPR